MPIRAEVRAGRTTTSVHYAGCGTKYLVKNPTGVLYFFYVDPASDVSYEKSTDNGLTWSDPVVVFTGNVTSLSVWYDRWSGIAADIIHCAYTENGGHNTLYRSLDTSSDTLGTETTIFDGATAVMTGSMLTITRARGGNLYVRVCIDAGAEGGFFRSTDVGATWGSRTINEALATTDQGILVPGWGADNQDAMMFFWDASADEISRQLYDDSANTWGETSIATSMVDGNPATTGFPHFAATVDIANSRNLLVAWSAVDAANADLRAWHVTESAITEVTNVVLNSTDDQGLCAIGIDSELGYWHVFYAGKSDGSETYATSVKIYYKTSTDGGATWGEEIALTAIARGASWLACTPIFARPFTVVVMQSSDFRVSAQISQPMSSSQLGS